MKILIACDMEGISGVTSFEQVDPSSSEYQRFRRLMTGDVNAAIAGAFEAGAVEVVVTDGHWFGSNILVEELDQRARLNTGGPAPLAMVQGAEAGVDAAFFVGYHARAGSQNAILDHTWSSSKVANVWLNGLLVGETGLNSSLCGYFNVPVLLVTGDQAVCEEARLWLTDVTTVAVKQASGRHAAEVLAPAVTAGLIRSGAKTALEHFKAEGLPRPVELLTPIKVTIEFIYADMADRAALYPHANRLDGRKLEVTCDSMLEAYQAFRAIVTLASR
jgi:D-amino peptidase